MASKVDALRIKRKYLQADNRNPVMLLAFNEAIHAYTVDGAQVPSVTGILRDCGLTGSYEFRDPIHSFRGTTVHACCAMIDAGITPRLAPLDPPYDARADYVRVHGEIPGYLNAFRGAKAALKFQGTVHECALIDPKVGYGGKFDFVATSLSPKTQLPQLWDIKSGIYGEMTIVQLCAYEDLIRRGYPVDEKHPGLEWLRSLIHGGQTVERCGLRLEKTGRWTAYYETSKGEPYGLPKWTAAWRSALTLHRMVPNHHYVINDERGSRTKSHLSDMGWVLEAIKANLKGAPYELSMRAGENIFNLRQAYNLL